MLVLGDTNSCLAVIPAKRRKIPIFHMEAGNRCFDQRVPEEINRRIVDHTADVNLTYSSIAREYLLREGLPPDLVIKTGSPMFEVLTHYRPQIDASDVLARLGLEAGGYFVVSAHREENIDATAHFGKLVAVLNAVAQDLRPAGDRLDAPAHAEAGRGQRHELPRRRAPAQAAGFPRLRASCRCRRARCCRTAARSTRSRRS